MVDRSQDAKPTSLEDVISFISGKLSEDQKLKSGGGQKSGDFPDSKCKIEIEAKLGKLKPKSQDGSGEGSQKSKDESKAEFESDIDKKAFD